MAAIISLTSTLYQLWQKQDILKEREAVRAQKELENTQLKKQLLQSKTDFFVEQEARNKLGLGKEGEVTILLPKSDPTPMKANDEAEDREISQEPNWKKWWRLFFL